MKRPRVIPCLLLSDGNLVKTKKFKNPDYLGDPINAVRIFNEKGVDELCVQDIGIAKSGGSIDFSLLSDIASEAFMPLCYGGGIRSLHEAELLFRIGFEKVMLNTALVENPSLVTDIAKRFGVQSVVASIDAAQNVLGQPSIAVRGGTKRSAITPKAMAVRAEELGAGEILLNSMQRDGMRNGYDLKLIREVTTGLKIPLIACGGAGKISDFAEALECGNAHAVAAGSLFVYYGPLQAVLIHMPDEEELRRAGVYQ